MYVPEHFAVEDPQEIIRVIETNPLAAIVSKTDDGFEATHAPLLAQQTDGALTHLQCHFARANLHWKKITGEVLVIFQGVESYITPSWYPSKQDTGKVVPTWNYETVHVHGQARVINDADWLLQHVSAVTDQFEEQRDMPWATSDAPKGFLQSMVRGIVGVEIAVSRIEAKIKASQNRPAADREGVVAGLNADGTPNATAMSKLVARYTGAADQRG